MPILQIEGRALRFSRSLAGFQPDSLTDFVRNRLPRNAEITVYLAGNKIRREMYAIAHELQSEIGCPNFAGMELGIIWYALFEVHSDVDDDTYGSQGLGVEHSHVVVGVFEVSKFVHQTLGI